MRRAKLDKIDRKILRDLQKDGRITNVELAKNVGISAPPCLRRVRSLEESGYIKSYHAKIDPSALGYSVTIFAMVKLTSQAEADLAVFDKRIKEWPMVRECHMLAGETDFLLKIVAKDWDSYQNFLTTELLGIPNVTSVKSSLGIRTTKDEPGRFRSKNNLPAFKYQRRSSTALKRWKGTVRSCHGLTRFIAFCIRIGAGRKGQSNGYFSCPAARMSEHVMSPEYDFGLS